MRELILTFHGLGESHALVSDQEKRYWWDAPSFAKFLDLVLDRPIDATQIFLTFDDGNASDALLALPALAKRRITATFFVCAGRIGMTYYLDKLMIRDLLDAGMCIGSHGMHHRDWCILDSRELEAEIADARKMIEDVAQKAVTRVAIPFGSYNGRVLRRLKKERWDCIYTSDRGTTYPTAKVKPRETVYASMQFFNFIPDLTQRPPLKTRFIRSLTRFYKRTF